MRGILLTGLLVLGLVALLNVDAMMRVRRATPAAGPDGEVDVLVFSTGRDLPEALYIPRQKGTDTAIIVGDQVLRMKEAGAGLRVATFGAGMELENHRNFDLARSDEDIAAFGAHCANQPIDTVMILTVSETIGSMARQNGDLHSALSETFERIDAQARPFEESAASWAMICMRRPTGWIALAEAYSQRQGVMLAFTIGSNPAKYDGVAAERVIDRRDPVDSTIPNEEESP